MRRTIFKSLQKIEEQTIALNIHAENSKKYVAVVTLTSCTSTLHAQNNYLHLEKFVAFVRWQPIRNFIRHIYGTPVVNRVFRSQRI